MHLSPSVTTQTTAYATRDFIRESERRSVTREVVTRMREQDKKVRQEVTNRAISMLAHHLHIIQTQKGTDMKHTFSLTHQFRTATNYLNCQQSLRIVVVHDRDYYIKEGR